MAHPVVSQIFDLAMSLAQELNLELVDIVFQTNKKPPVLRVDVRNPTADTSLEDCERMSHALETKLDATDIISGSYVLEVSSPGISRALNTDRDFICFKGFSVIIKTFAPYKNHKEWQGKLQGRDEEAVYINQKGKEIAIPRNLVAKVQLEDGS
jgi:ribosome maturation factor RimP